MSGGRGKATAWAAGIACMAVIAIGIRYRPEIVTAYHLRILQRDRSSLPGLLRSERTPGQERALERYLRTPAGGERLFACCLDGSAPPSLAPDLVEALEGYFATAAGQGALREAFLAGAFRSADRQADLASLPSDLKVKGFDKVTFGLNLVDGLVDGVTYERNRYNWGVSANGGGGGGNGDIRADGNEGLIRIIDLLKFLQPGSFPSTGFPGLECTVGRRGDRYVWCQAAPR